MYSQKTLQHHNVCIASSFNIKSVGNSDDLVQGTAAKVILINDIAVGCSNCVGFIILRILVRHFTVSQFMRDSTVLWSVITPRPTAAE